MIPMPALLPSYAEAAALIAERAARLCEPGTHSEQVALNASLDRVLARPIRADRDMPSFSRSTRDGFACRAAEASSRTPLPWRAPFAPAIPPRVRCRPARHGRS